VRVSVQRSCGHEEAGRQQTQNLKNGVIRNLFCRIVVSFCLFPFVFGEEPAAGAVMANSSIDFDS
jgi:hypothetical protein